MRLEKICWFFLEHPLNVWFLNDERIVSCVIVWLIIDIGSLPGEVDVHPFFSEWPKVPSTALPVTVLSRWAIVRTVQSLNSLLKVSWKKSCSGSLFHLAFVWSLVETQSRLSLYHTVPESFRLCNCQLLQLPHQEPAPEISVGTNGNPKN